jgi:hypothetical protein
VTEDVPPEETIDLADLGGLHRQYYKVARAAIKPVIEHIWPSFRVTRYDTPYILRYRTGDRSVYVFWFFLFFFILFCLHSVSGGLFFARLEP